MVNGIPSQPFYDKLFNQDIREGIWDGTGLFTKTFNNELAISSEHTPDFSSWTFKLPPNVKFHNLPPVNGRTLTAEDVVFSFQRHIDTNVIKSTLRQVDKVTAVDNVTVRFDLKQPQLRFPATLASPHLPVFARESFENHDRFITQPIGTGPFVLESSQYQDKAVWVRNPEYWKPPPYRPEKYGTKPLPMFDKVTRTAYGNAVGAREAFYAGEVDEFPGNSTDPAIVKEALTRVPNALVNSNGYWSCCPLGILFQYKNPLFQDIRIRQALSLSIDREAVWSQGMQKTGVIIASPVPLDDMGSDFPPPLEEYGPNAQPDVARAKQLLKAAGHDEPLKLQLYAGPRTGSPFEWPLEVIPFMWKQAGIADVTIVTRDSLVLLKDQLDKSFPDMLYPGSLSLPFAFTLDSMVMPAFLTDSPANYGSLSDPTLDGLFDQWSAATDPAKGQDIARQIAKRFVENVDHVWFTNHGGVDIVQPWLHGCVFTPYAAINYIGMSSNKFMWIDETAPGGRGGTRIT
ncbi:MAG: ABC transporter substrate-binding protein [Dehalococcoidia bacterium]